jgi:hypothetical protein
MSQQRYNTALQEFIRQWRPNNPELDKRFIDSVRQLLAAILTPPASVFEVGTILSPTGGKVTVRVADFEAQLDPLDAQHLALSLLEAAASARVESQLFRFVRERLDLDHDRAAMMIAEFRHYRMEEMQRELDGDFARRTVIPDQKP